MPCIIETRLDTLMHSLLQIRVLPEDMIEALCYYESAPEYHTVSLDINPVGELSGYAQKKDVIVHIWDLDYPAFLDTWVIEVLADPVDGWTGYTHQWLTCDQELSQYLMASIDQRMANRYGMTLPDLVLYAADMGWRCFIVTDESMPNCKKCPAAIPGKVTCSKCLACSGTNGRGKGHRSIPAHGSGAVNL